MRCHFDESDDLLLDMNNNLFFLNYWKIKILTQNENIEFWKTLQRMQFFVNAEHTP